MAAFAFMCVEGRPNTRLKTSDIIWKSVIAIFSHMGVPRIRDEMQFQRQDPVSYGDANSGN
jgi:hypothetical protein